MTWDPERAVEGDEYDEDGAYPERPCVACAEPTPLRCAKCTEPVCERHDQCPNGCDAPARVAPMPSAAELARALRARLAPPKP